jgi:hypothetical protein
MCIFLLQTNKINEEHCGIGYEEQNEWYFFSYKDRKYPTGTRTNRATMAGFWKATGRDKAVHEKSRLIGMRKTLVFYKGRAPNGQKTDWIMHEYRLEIDENAPPQASKLYPPSCMQHDLSQYMISLNLPSQHIYIDALSIYYYYC